MTRARQSQAVAIQAAAAAGATCSLGFTRGGHQVAVLGFNGRTRKVFFAKTPSDNRTLQNTRRDVRKVLRELKEYQHA